MVQYSQLRTATLRSVFAGAYVVSCSHCALVSYLLDVFSVLPGSSSRAARQYHISASPLDTRFGMFDGKVTTAVTSCVACLPHLSGENEDFGMTIFLAVE